MTVEEAARTVNEIFALYEEHGSDDYIGERVSQTEHMVQAALLAEDEGYDEEVILAAFFHDIGHLCEHLMPVAQMDGYGVADHERLAGRYLREKRFSNKIAKLAESHVQAKRYLTYQHQGYYGKLSEASKMTLAQQGGPMNAEEAGEFERNPLCDLIIKLREWDDKAKRESQALPALDKYKAMALRHLLESHSLGS